MRRQNIGPYAGIFALLALLVSCGSAPVKDRPGSMERHRHELDYPGQWRPLAPLRFLVVGDTQNPKPGDAQNDAERQAIYARLSVALADSVPVVHLGDLVENGSRLWQWRKFFDAIFWDRLSADQRRLFFPIPGNHDYKTRFFAYGGGDLSLYYERFPHIGHQRYYFFTRGDACFVFMDAGRNGIAKLLWGERWQNGVEEQLEWLEAVVLPHVLQKAQSAGLRRIFLFFHKPGYVTPVYVKNRQSVRLLRRLDEFNRENGHRFEIFAFTGHVHTFAHIARDYDGDGRPGIDQFIVGTGGGTQRGWKYYRKVERVEDLDLYRREQYRRGVADGGSGPELFDRVRRDHTLFGYLEVVAGDEVRVLYHRYDRKDGRFYIDYEFVR